MSNQELSLNTIATLEKLGFKVEAIPAAKSDCNCDEDDKDAAPGPFGKTYVVPMEYAEDVQADTGTGIEYGASLLFVPSSQHVMAIMDKIPPNSWSFDNELLHAGIEHIVLDPEAGAEITFAWEVK